MKRLLDFKFTKTTPEYRARRLLTSARRAKPRPGQTIGRAPQRYRPEFGGRRHVLQARRSGRTAKEVKRAFEVVDDFPNFIPVSPEELRVIEIYLGKLLDESLEPMDLARDNPASGTAKRDVE